MRAQLNLGRDWRAIAIVALAAFVFFSAGAFTTALLAGERPATDAVTLGVRFGVSLLISAVLLLIERRRDVPSIDAALREGLLIAAIVVVTNNLVGSDVSGVQLAVRTAAVVIGLPLLSALTHVLARRWPSVNAAGGMANG